MAVGYNKVRHTWEDFPQLKYVGSAQICELIGAERSEDNIYTMKY